MGNTPIGDIDEPITSNQDNKKESDDNSDNLIESIPSILESKHSGEVEAIGQIKEVVIEKW